jgi:TM2 domain
MKSQAVLLFSFILLIGSIKADNTKNPIFFHTELVEVLSKQDFSIAIEQDSTTIKVKFKRGKAILFTLFTGFLGGHRIYFGTHHRTPIIYSVTLGGLGILPLVDLIHIIFTKDLSKFEHKSQIIMWGK